MARWDYNLKTHGLKLRELVDVDNASQENCTKILEQMIVCCKYLQEILTEEDKEWYEYDLEEMIQNCEDIKCYLDEFDEDSNEDNINDILEQFYDLMDSMSVWIAL